MGFAHRQLASVAVVEPWGMLGAEIDEEALAAGRLKFTRLKLRFPDSTPVDTTVADALPPARDLPEGLSPDRQSLVVLAALPLLNASGSNCRFDETALVGPRRSYREYVQVTDLNGMTDAEVAVERLAVRLLFDFEPQADDTVCPVARLSRGASGRFQLDRRYVPPCLSLAAHPLHLEQLERLAAILLAKSVALSARKRERIEQVAEYGVADISLFWLLHTVHSYWPQLRLLATHPEQPPIRLYDILAQLASTLTTFSTHAQLADIPAYEHTRQGEIFAKLETLIRDLLDTSIPSRVVAIGLARKSATTWAAQFLDDRLVAGADYYLSVHATMPPLDLIEQVPRLCKIGAPDDVEQIVNVALAGIPLKPVQRVPAAIPVRLDDQYFVLDATDPGHARMLAARACQIYLPGSVPDASLELYAVLRA